MSRNRLVLGLTAILAFAVGYLLANGLLSRESPIALNETPAFRLPIAAQRLWFPPLEDYFNDGEPMADEKFEDLFSILKDRLAAEETSADFQREAGVYLSSFVRRISVPSLKLQQTERIMSFLTELEEQHPDDWLLIRRRGNRVQSAARPNSRIRPFSRAISWFPKIETLQAETEQFSDGTIEELIGVLELLLSMPETVRDIEREAGWHIRSFARVLQQRRPTGTQIAQAAAYLNEVKAKHPALGELIDQSRYRIEKLTPGQLAPNITGTDLKGVDFELQDYRGTVVVLYFTGQWCGPCRTEYPYQRLMLEIFNEDSVTLLAVNSDDDRDYALRAREDSDLHFRAWWDGYGEHHAFGPIATAWDVREWPTIYVLDANGVIRYVHKHDLEVVLAAQVLLDELPLDRTSALRNEPSALKGILNRFSVEVR